MASWVDLNRPTVGNYKPTVITKTKPSSTQNDPSWPGLLLLTVGQPALQLLDVIA